MTHRTRPGTGSSTNPAAMRSTAALAAALLLLAAAAAAPITAATSSPADSSSDSPATTAAATCLLVHLRDRNMRALERRAAEAAGLAGPRAGAYLTAEQVAQLAGRSREELRALSAFVGSLGGQMHEVGPLRDLAAACFPAPALASLLAAAAEGSASAVSQSAEQAELVAVTRQAAAAAAALVSPAAAAAAHALAAVLPPQLARFTAAIEPLPSQHAASGAAAPSADGGSGNSSNSSSGVLPSSVRHRSLLEQQQHQAGADAASPPTSSSFRWPGPFAAKQGGPLWPPTFGHEGEGATPTAAGGSTMPDWQPVSVEFALNVPSGYGPPLPASLGSFTGFADPVTKTAWGVPQFTPWSLLYFLGVSNPATMLNTMNSSALAAAVMLPCQLALGPGNTVTNMTYATAATAAACTGQFTVRFRESYAGNPGKLSPVRSVALPPSAVRVMSCGAVVARSGGRLPASTCGSIGRQLAAANNLSAPIGPDTALYLLDVAAVLPTFTGINNLTVSVRLAPSVPAIYRNFGVLSALSQPYPMSVAGRNRPRDLRPLYGAAPLENRGTAKGLLVAPSLFVPYPYDYSPEDLSIANKALGTTVPQVVDVVNPPVFPRNRPARCYSDSGCGEPSLDIQMVTQYGQGSGAAFGFVASSNDQVFTGLSLAALYRANLNLKPLPDVLSWSYAGQPIDRAQLYPAQAVLAKMAAMGITVLASSGDSGAFFGAATADTVCQQPITPSYAAASEWVTAVGAVMEARPAAGQPPQLVACMAPIGGVVTSGGGFGNTSLGATPAWQAKAVQRYVASQRGKASWPLSAANRGRNSANFSVNCTGSGATERCVYGRAYPDISLVGAGVPVMVAGIPSQLFGTSISAPMFAGLVMQLNAAIRATPGLERCKIGYMNPFLYWAAERYPTAFTDITVGSNNFNKNYATACPQGYHAAVGWDAVTGLGVPNMRVLQKAAIEYLRSQAGCADTPPNK